MILWGDYVAEEKKQKPGLVDVLLVPPERYDIFNELTNILDRIDEIRELRKAIDSEALDSLEALAKEVDTEDDFKEFYLKAKVIGKQVNEHNAKYDALKKLVVKFLESLRP